MKKTAMPSAYPVEGVYKTNHFHVHLGAANPKAVIHYTVDGTTPTLDSPVYDPLSGGIQLLPFFNNFIGQKKTHIVQAIAAAEGLAPSDVSRFAYTLMLDPKGSYSHELLRDGAKDQPALIRIMDYLRVNMYLVIGSERALLIDAGMDKEADLPSLIDRLSGGLPLSVVISHGHVDHYGQISRFLERGIPVYLPAEDLPVFQRFGDPIPSGTIDVKEGDRFDLGNTVLTVYSLPGHTPGGIVLLDEKTGDLYTSDQLGNNNPIGPNTGLLNLGGPECALDRYYAALSALRDALGGRAKRVLSGHNDHSIPAGELIQNTLLAIRNVLEQGDDALVPCIRPASETMGSSTLAAYGDYRTDAAYVGMNVRYLYEKDALSNPPKYARGGTPPDSDHIG